MGFFFDEPKKPEVQDTSASHVSHGPFATAMLMVLGFFIAILGWIIKPLFSWLFDFSSVTQQVATIKIVIIAIIVGGPILLIYRIPSVRDTLTLSNTSTTNIPGNECTFFPDRSYFVPTRESVVLTFEQSGSRLYFTYKGYTKNLASEIGKGSCHLVSRGEKIVLASNSPPICAVGFESTVQYTVVKSVASLPSPRYIQEHVIHPSYLFRKKDELSKLKVNYDVDESWGTFTREWSELWSFTNGSKPFEIKALSNEHALICF